MSSSVDKSWFMALKSRVVSRWVKIFRKTLRRKVSFVKTLAEHLIHSRYSNWKKYQDDLKFLTLKQFSLFGLCEPSSDQISCSVVSDSLRPHELQHARPSCPSPTSGVHWDSRSSSQWWHPAISSSVVPCSSCPQSLPASESFPSHSSHEVAKVLEFQL